MTDLELQSLQAERDALAAQVEQLRKLHCKLTNADMVFDDETHSGYLITSDQLEKMESILTTPAQILAEIKADAIEDAAEKLFAKDTIEAARLRIVLFEYANTIRSEADQ